LTWAKHIPELDPMPPKHYNLSCFTMQVDLATGRSLSPARMVRHNSTIGNWVSEGPHIIKRGEWYYLITADGGTHTAHQEWVCRTREGPFGPWEEGPSGINPVIYNGNDGVVTMTGHSELNRLGLCLVLCGIDVSTDSGAVDMVEGTDGRWWAVCLAVRPQNGHQSQLGRETFLMLVEWVDDWPVVNGGDKIGLCGPLSAGLPRLPPQSSWVANFKPNMGQ
jgi:beta-xylosidase